MRVLQFAKKFPYPLRDGESWAITALAQGLKHHQVSIDLLALNTSQHFADREDIESLEALEIYDISHTVKVHTTTNRLGASVNLLSSVPYHQGRYYQESVKKKLSTLLGEEHYDVILIESTFLLTYIGLIRRTVPDAKLVLRAHNVEYLIWERYANGLDGIKSWYFGNQASRLRTFESRMIGSVDGVLTVSVNDKQILQECCDMTVPSLVCPIGITPMRQEVSKIHETRSHPFILGFIGSLDWRPNIEGLKWFLSQVWPRCLDDDLDMVVMIAGRNASPTSKFSHLDGVNFLGEIDDSDAFMDQIDLLIAPLWSGSGTRVKVLQALGSGTPVLGTRITFEGLPVSPDEQVLVGETPDEWLDHLTHIRSDATKYQSLAEKGYQYVVQHHDQNEIGRHALEFVRAL